MSSMSGWTSKSHDAYIPDVEGLGGGTVDGWKIFIFIPITEK